MVTDKSGNKAPLYLRLASETKIRRHIKILSNANPFDPCFKEYFKRREKLTGVGCFISNDTGSAGLRYIQP